MRPTPRLSPRLCAPAAWSLIAALLILLQLGDAYAQDGVIRRGDAVVTGFSGAKYPKEDLPPDVHALDRKTIDLDGTTLRVIDLSQLTTAPDASLVDVPTRFSLKARDIGHVFGIAFDGDGTNGPPNIYVTATSIYGLHLVVPGPNGTLQRTITGGPNARFMDGLFGSAPGGGPGTIYRIDGRTGQVSILANITNNGRENGGAGLGAIAFDPVSRLLYVSDLETGLIHRVTTDGRVLDAFDHGVTGRPVASLQPVPYTAAPIGSIRSEMFNAEDPLTWGFADRSRMVWGVAVQNGRLYYGAAEGPQVWSVGLNPDGTFGSDPRLEIDVSGTPAGNAITSITFDGPGVLYLSQRGAHLGSYDFGFLAKPQESVVVRYSWNETRRFWEPVPEEYAVGMPVQHRAGLGGVALGYGYDRQGRIDFNRCRQTAWVTGEHLREGSELLRVSTGGPRLVHGLQGHDKGRVRPVNEPPTEAWFIDFDNKFEQPESSGHVGNVAIPNACQPGRVQPTAAEETVIPVSAPRLRVEKRCEPGAIGSQVRCVITVRNQGDAVASDTIELVDVTHVLHGPSAGDIIKVSSSTPDGPEWSCATGPDGDHVCRISGSLLAPGAARSVDVLVDTRDLVLNASGGFRNCVKLNSPYGSNRACAEGGSGVIVEKSGPAECTADGECAFTLKVTNLLTERYKGDLLFADSMFFEGAPKPVVITSISPPIGCSEEPEQLPFACVANTTLEAGEVRYHVITVQMPAPGGYWAQNCAAVGDGWILSSDPHLRGFLRSHPVTNPDKPATYPSCVWVKVPGATPVAAPGAPAGSITPTLGLLPPVAACEDGRPVPPSGRCPCPRNAIYNVATGQCEQPMPVCWSKDRQRPDGGCCPSGTVWWARTQSCELARVLCPFPSRRQPDGACCPSGTVWSRASNSCAAPVATCADGRSPLANGYCRCPIGTRWNPERTSCDVIANVCSDPARRTPDGSCCSSGTVWSPRYGTCVGRIVSFCGPGEIRGPLGGCLALPRPCAFGSFRNRFGTCGRPILPVIARGCPSGLVRAGHGCIPRVPIIHRRIRLPDRLRPRPSGIRPPLVRPRRPNGPIVRPKQNTPNRPVVRPRPKQTTTTRPQTQTRTRQQTAPRRVQQTPRSIPRRVRTERSTPRVRSVPQRQPRALPRSQSRSSGSFRSGGGGGNRGFGGGGGRRR